MRYTVKIVSSYFVMAMLTAGLFANDGVKKERLPDHKKAKPEHAVQDIAPGAVQNIDPDFVETKPINDVIHSVVPREQQSEAKTPLNRVRRNINYGEPRKDYTKVELERLVQRAKTNKRSLSQEELMVVEDYIQSQEQNKRTITTIANNSTDSYNRFSRAATDLLISEYCDFDESGYTGARFIEIYNPTDTDIDLGTAGVDTNLYIARYANGGESSYSVVLSGTIAAGDVFVVANNQAKFTEKFGIEADLYSSTISGNGDDCFALSTTGYPADPLANIFDVLGEVGVDGDDEAWNYEDQTIVRNPGSEPNTTWTAAEWFFGAGDATFATPGSHDYDALSEGFEGTFPPMGGQTLQSLVTPGNSLHFIQMADHIPLNIKDQHILHMRVS